MSDERTETLFKHLDRDRAMTEEWAGMVRDERALRKKAEAERDSLRTALLEWWDDPDNPPLLAAQLARQRDEAQEGE